MIRNTNRDFSLVIESDHYDQCIITIVIVIMITKILSTPIFIAILIALYISIFFYRGSECPGVRVFFFSLRFPE